MNQYSNQQNAYTNLLLAYAWLYTCYVKYEKQRKLEYLNGLWENIRSMVIVEIMIIKDGIKSLKINKL